MFSRILRAIRFGLVALLTAALLVGGAAVAAFISTSGAAEFVPPPPKVGEAIVEQEAQPADPAIAVNALSGVLITQCNQIVAAYVTLTDGRLVRFDIRDQEEITPTALEALIYSARVSERVEFSCDGASIEGYEQHERPI